MHYRCAGHLLTGQVSPAPSPKFKPQPKALGSRALSVCGAACRGLSMEAGAASLGMCLGGGRGRLLLLGGGFQQSQLLGQAGAGFHHHIMFNLLPDPDL